jgi:uncharacterized SAM-binding protein YcdF (DUF218 family)
VRLPAAREVAGDLLTLLRVYRGGVLAQPSRGKIGRARVAVVLGAQVLPDGRPSRTLGARARHAARLHAGGRVGLLIPTGGLGEHPPTEAEVMARVMREEGVPEAAVLLEDEALNTWDSALLVSRMVREIGVEEVLVVTDPLHCVRTIAAFEEAGLIAWAEPVYSSPMWRERWSRRGQLAREMGALVWYRARHGVGSRSRR